MTGSRCYVGTDPSCEAAVAWRDAHQFSFEIPGLAAMYFANPSKHEALPKKVNYTTVLDGTDHGSAAINDPAANAPDVVKHIVWALDSYDAHQINHPMLKAQLAAFLHAYPNLTDYVDQATYEHVRDFAFNTWTNTARNRSAWHENTAGGSYDGNLLQTYTNIGTGKGSFPPGWTILPNLMMYEVALREGRSDAQLYFDAAYDQTQWLIDTVDWVAPENTKGQRMSEHAIMEGLAYFAKTYPDTAPSGLEQKIVDWAEIVISRSDNMWDFRKYDDTATGWVIPGLNEPGNVMGLPGSIFAAIDILQDKEGYSSAKIDRLREIAIAHIDNVFGRNPAGRHFRHDARRDFEGVERGWYSEYQGGFGRLNDTIGVFDGAPKPEHYPYFPDAGNPGWTEGWVAFNTAWNASLAYYAYDRTSVDVKTSDFSASANTLSVGDTLYVELAAPVNFNYNLVETAEVVITSTNGDREVLTVTETSNNGRTLRGTLATSGAGTVAENDGTLTVGASDSFAVTYGMSYFQRAADFVGNGAGGFDRN